MSRKYNLCTFTAVFTIGMSLYTCGVFAAMDPRFELDTAALGGAKQPVKAAAVPKKRTPRPVAAQDTAPPVKKSIYTIKQGDNLFKILIRDFGLNNTEAESFLEEIKRENNIYDIKRLKIGQKIVIPSVKRNADGSLKVLQAQQSEGRHPGEPRQSLQLASPVPALSGQEAVAQMQNVWSRLVPVGKEQQKPLSLKTSTFSLTLDPERYPAFTRMDGGRVILDQNGSIPPLVKSLIEEKDASVRIVSEVPAGSKRFVASLLETAGFYSVEENFSMEFGADPKITVHADFKIEKTPESLIKQDVVLINSGRTALPLSIGEFIKREGFSLYEPFASLKPVTRQENRPIHYIAPQKQPEMTDAILGAFSVAAERERNVDVFAADNNGISLAVKAERYFERGGQKYVVTSFDGDPINYTLFRILETKGYKVVILEAQDDFRKIADKLISRMKLKGTFEQHSLLQDPSAGFTLQMSGYKLDDPLLGSGGVFITDRVMDRIVRDVLVENGFTVNSR